MNVAVPVLPGPLSPIVFPAPHPVTHAICPVYVAAIADGAIMRAKIAAVVARRASFVTFISLRYFRWLIRPQKLKSTGMNLKFMRLS